MLSRFIEYGVIISKSMGRLIGNTLLEISSVQQWFGFLHFKTSPHLLQLLYCEAPEMLCELQHIPIPVFPSAREGKDKG